MVHIAWLHNNLGQVVHTQASLSPSSIMWYWPTGRNAVTEKVTMGGNSPCMASPAGQTNQGGLELSGSIHEEAHLGLS